MYRMSRITLILSAILTMWPRVSVAQIEYRYAILALPDLGGGYGYAWGINAQGDVIGSARIADLNVHATLWLDETVIDLGTLGGPGSSARGVNSALDIVGWSNPPGGGLFDYRAFFWRDQVLTQLPSFEGGEAEASAILDDGTVVGWVEVFVGQDSIRWAAMWRKGRLERLPNIDGSSVATDVSESAVIVGYAYDSMYRELRAVVWIDGVIRSLGVLRSDGRGKSQAFGVNDLGHVVGSSDADGVYKTNAFLWVDGRMYNLGRLPGTDRTHGFAVNNRTEIVGWGGGEGKWAFLWRLGEGMTKLDDLLAARSGWRLLEAWDINDAGLICGVGKRNGGTDTAYVLSPVNPTMAMAAPAPGRAGEANTLTVSNCTPGATVQFLYSRNGGGERIPGCDLQQNALQLDSPTVIGTAIADQSGVASITRTVPPVARNQTILFQAVVQNECAISRLVVHQFE